MKRWNALKGLMYITAMLLALTGTASAQYAQEGGDTRTDPFHYATYEQLRVQRAQEDYLKHKSVRRFIRDFDREGYIQRLQTELNFVFAAKEETYITIDTFVYTKDSLGRVAGVKRNRLRNDAPEGVQEEADSFAYAYRANGRLGKVEHYREGQLIFYDTFVYDSTGRLHKRISGSTLTRSGSAMERVWELHYDDKGRNTLTRHRLLKPGNALEAHADNSMPAETWDGATFHLYDDRGNYAGHVQRQETAGERKYAYPLCTVISSSPHGLPLTVKSYTPGQVAAYNWNNIFKTTPETQAADWQLIRCPEGDNDRDRSAAFSQFSYTFFR